MRGLWKALFLAPALAAALSIVPDTWTDDQSKNIDNVNDFNPAIGLTSTPGSSSAVIFVQIPPLSKSPDAGTTLSLRIDVLASEEMCGYGNITINGQDLAQEATEYGSSGHGSIADNGRMVDASWFFSCFQLLGQPTAQVLRFTIESVDEKDVQDVAVVVIFRQSDGAEILSTSLSIGSLEKMLPSPDLSDDAEVVMDFEDDNIEEETTDVVMDFEDDNIEEKTTDVVMDFEDYNMEEEITELEWMRSEIQYLEYQVYQKEEVMAIYTSEVIEEGIDECDSLKCVVRFIFHKVRKTAHRVVHKVYSKLARHHGDEDSEEDGITAFPKRPHWKKPHCRKPHWRKPHWRKPHWRKPPFHHPGKHGNHSHHNHTCPCPPRSNHTHSPWPPHRCPPHHSFPPHHGPPKWPPGRHHRPRPPHGCPPPGHPGKRPGHRPGPPDNDKQHRPPLPGEGPPRPPHDDDQGPHLEPLPPSGPSDFESRLHGHIGRKLHRVKQAAKYLAVGSLVILLFAAIHRRPCSKARRQAKQARREERRRRRAFRRAAHKHAWKSWFIRHICRSTSQEELDYEEKQAMLVSEGAEEAGQDGDEMASEIRELRNAANVVDDIVAAEEGRVSTDSRSSLPDYLSQLGGESLPTYEDSDGSEMSGVVADGFLYTPGSTGSEYTPGHSDAGSVGDVLGDLKE